MADRDVEVAWAAGLFEGEGSLYIHDTPVALKSGHRIKRQAHAAVSMTDRDVIERFGRIVGFGAVGGPFGHGKYKPVWRWHAGRRSEVFALIDLFGPWMGERRSRKARELLDLGEIRPRTHCHQGHPIEGPSARVYWWNGQRRCVICRAIGAKRRYQERKAAA